MNAQRGRKVPPALAGGFRRRLRSEARPAELRIIAVQQTTPATRRRRAERVVLARHGRAVERYDHWRAALPRRGLTHESEHALRCVVRVDPAEALPCVIARMQLGTRAIQPVERASPGLPLLMMRMLYGRPRKILVVAPLVPLTELPAHEHQLLAGVSHHVADEQAIVGQLAPFIARHLVEQRALPVHYLIVRQRQYE